MAMSSSYSNRRAAGNPYKPLYSTVSIYRRSVSERRPRPLLKESTSTRKNNNKIDRNAMVRNFSSPVYTNIQNSHDDPDTSGRYGIFTTLRKTTNSFWDHWFLHNNNNNKRNLDSMETNSNDSTDNIHTDSNNHTAKKFKLEQDTNKELNISKDPFGWNKWEIKPFTVQDDDKPYGSTFIRNRNRNRNYSYDKHNELYKHSDEIDFLRKIFNGEEQMPKSVKDERENQLRLMEQDKLLFRHHNNNDLGTNNNNSNTKIKKSIIDLTGKIKSMLINGLNQDTKNGQLDDNTDDDDLIFIKERKISSLENKYNQYYHDTNKFNDELIKLQRQFKNYKQLIEQRRQIQDDLKREKDLLRLNKKLKIIPSLNNDQLEEIQNVLNSQTNSVLYNKDNIEVTVRDIKTLAPKRWLNDTIIEFFMKNIENNKDNNIVAFNSFFYSNLSERGYSSVRRWLKRKKISLDLIDKIFIPINLNQSHWALGFIDLRKKEIKYVDSLSSGPNPSSLLILENIKNYLLNESQNKIGSDFKLIHEKCPQQPNGFDCGVFVCMNTLYLSKDLPLTFNSQDASNMRHYIANLIINN